MKDVQFGGKGSDNLCENLSFLIVIFAEVRTFCSVTPSTPSVAGCRDGPGGYGDYPGRSCISINAYG